MTINQRTMRLIDPTLCTGIAGARDFRAAAHLSRLDLGDVHLWRPSSVPTSRT